jgi:hypothetical protein
MNVKTWGDMHYSQVTTLMFQKCILTVGKVNFIVITKEMVYHEA